MTMGVYLMEMPTFNTLATSYCSEESTKTYVVMRESGAFWPIRVQPGGESLKKQKWEYTITNGITGVIISFIMLTIFGGLALWFRLSRNGAIIIGIILVIFASLAFFLALYRTLFFRVLIDKDGFFYQTAPGNGRYYHYYTIRQIWVSSGNDANAQQMQYCNFEMQDGRIMRFFFRNLDWDAVDYLIAQVENTEGQAQRSDGDLMISGRVQGGVRLVAAVCILAAVLFVSIYLRTQGLPPIIYIPPVVLAVAAFFVLVSHNLFYKILIQKDGFYCRTNPFDGKYYKYSEISNCHLTEVVQRQGSVRNGTRRTGYSYYFTFTDSIGKPHKILYDKALFQREMEVLMERSKGI